MCMQKAKCRRIIGDHRIIRMECHGHTIPRKVCRSNMMNVQGCGLFLSKALKQTDQSRLLVPSYNAWCIVVDTDSTVLRIIPSRRIIPRLECHSTKRFPAVENAIRPRSNGGFHRLHGVDSNHECRRLQRTKTRGLHERIHCVLPGEMHAGGTVFLKMLYTHLFQCGNGGATQIVQFTDRHHYRIIHITGKLCKGKQCRTKTPHLLFSGLDRERPIVRRNNDVVAFCRRCVPLIIRK